MFCANFCLYSDTDSSDEAVSAARDYIARNGLTQEDVRLRKNENGVSVWTKRDGVKINE